MVKSRSRGFTNGEDLVKDLRMEISKISLALCYVSGGVMSVIPAWLFHKMHWIEPYFFMILLLVSPLSAYLLTTAYTNGRQKIKDKIVTKHEHLLKNFKSKLFREKWPIKKDKVERIFLHGKQIDDFEATLVSIFYNNSLFLGIIIFSNFMLLRSFAPLPSLCLSTVGTAGFLAVLSNAL
ncbi:unnamed protein product [Tenebrio molitor]|jgi:hypothetical protein|nr:unnamed protein product [Tenebrio molitor]